MYSGTAYIGVVGPEMDYSICRDSIERVLRRTGDSPINYHRATKGYEARQKHVTNFINSHHDWLLLLDHDMVFSADTLERLRSHGKPYVSGYYLRRQYQPIAPVWFKYGPFGVWPMEPWTADPERGKLHKIGASGWGCILIHREVIEKTREVLKGEWDVLEDDMDIWPYDLSRMMTAIHGLQELVREKPHRKTLLPALEHWTQVLTEEVRPLRGTYDRAPTGSDIRFPFYARAAGFTLWGDPDVRPGHMLHYSLTPDDYGGVPDEMRQTLQREVSKALRKARKAYRENSVHLEIA